MNVNVSTDENILSTTIYNSTNLHSISYRWPALFLIFFSLFGIVGNVLVCLAIGTERRLQNRTNWFLVSLAFADLLLSGLVIPLAIVKEFAGFWILGPVLCDLWIFFDVCSCTSSIMHIVVISIDRYLAIDDPLNVRSRQENYQILLWISLIWFIAIFLSSPLIVLGMINPLNIIIDGQCLINNQFFVIYGSVVSFVIPLIIVIVMYILTVRRLKEQIKQCQRQFAQEQLMNTANLVAKPFLRRPLIRQKTVDGSSSQSILFNATESRRKRFQRQQTSFELSEATSLDNFTWKKAKTFDSTNSCQHRTTTASNVDACPKCFPSPVEFSLQTDRFSRSTPTGNELSSGLIDSTSKQIIKRRRLRSQWTRLTMIGNLSSTRSKSSAIRNERKAVKVLGVVFVIFVIAWFPFCITNLLQAICKNCSINPNLLNSFVWLGYVSSAINPIVYTIFNRNFRRKFLALLQCQCFTDTDRQRHLSLYRSYSSLHHNSQYQRNVDQRRINFDQRMRSETLPT